MSKIKNYFILGMVIIVGIYMIIPSGKVGVDDVGLDEIKVASFDKSKFLELSEKGNSSSSNNQLNSSNSNSSNNQSDSSNGSSTVASAKDVKEWLEACKIVADWFNDYGTVYDIWNSYSPYGPIDKEPRTNCGYGVIACLAQAGYGKLGAMSAGETARQVHQKLGWDIITKQSDTGPGDIIFMKQPKKTYLSGDVGMLERSKEIGAGYHVQIKIKDGQYYNWGTTTAMKNNPRDTTEAYISQYFICGLRFQPPK